MRAAGRPRARVEFANRLRGLAALSVLGSHYAGMFWLEPAIVSGLTQLPPADVAVPPFVAAGAAVPMFHAGSFGVALFFIISGFVIPFSFRSLDAGQFLLARAFRIYPTYMCGFALSLVVIYLNCRWTGRSFPYGPAEVIFHFVPGLHALLGFPSIDGVIWTLDIEVMFYLVCAAIAGPLRRTSPAIFIMPLLLFLLAAGLRAAPAAIAASIHMIPFIIFMFCGVSLHFLHIGRLPLRHVLLLNAVLLPLFVACTLVTNTLPPGELPSYGIALFVFAVAMKMPGLSRLLPFGTFFAAVSYPLYASHAVLGYSGLSLMTRLGLSPITAIALMSCIAIAVAMALHHVVEVPSHGFGRRLAMRIGGPLRPGIVPSV